MLEIIAAHQGVQLLVADAGKHGGISDLVPVQIQDWQHTSIADGIGELVAVPAGGELSKAAP